MTIYNINTSEFGLPSASCAEDYNRALWIDGINASKRLDVGDMRLAERSMLRLPHHLEVPMNVGE